MSTVRVYKSTDPNAPAHPSNVRGSMAALLRACLVTGYGSISITLLVVTSGVAMATVSGGNRLIQGQRVAISGATPATLNADWRITAADASTFSFACPDIADVTATGTITAALPPAGWEEPFPETNNYACFRALEGARQFYQVDDNQTDADVAKLVGCESMSDASTPIGTWGSPYFGKWYSAETAISWWVVADQRTCYVFLGARYGQHTAHCFGEFFSYLDDDPYNSYIGGHPSSASVEGYNVSMTIGVIALGATANAPMHCHKSLNGTHGASLSASVMNNPSSASLGLVGNADWSGILAGYRYPLFPHLFHCPQSVEDAYAFRGHSRGLHLITARIGHTTGTIITVGGRDLMVAQYMGHGGNYTAGQFLIDVTDGWA